MGLGSGWLLGVGSGVGLCVGSGSGVASGVGVSLGLGVGSGVVGVSEGVSLGVGSGSVVASGVGVLLGLGAGVVVSGVLPGVGGGGVGRRGGTVGPTGLRVLVCAGVVGLADGAGGGRRSVGEVVGRVVVSCGCAVGVGFTGGRPTLTAATRQATEPAAETTRGRRQRRVIALLPR